MAEKPIKQTQETIKIEQKPKDEKKIEKQPPKEKKEEEKSTFTFLMVCDLVDTTKNISGVITAFKEVINRSQKVKLKIIGDGQDRDSLQKLVTESDLDTSIEFIGRLTQDEVLEFYPSVDCVVVNSNFETYSMVTAEAILSGVPVIATRCNGPEQFINNNNGILIDLNNPEQLVNSMISIQTKNFSTSSIINSQSINPSNTVVGKELLAIYQAHL